MTNLNEKFDLHYPELTKHFALAEGGMCDFHYVYDKAIEEAKDGALFVEVGCWLGMSSVYMLEAIEHSSKKIDLICIDTWTGNVFGQGSIGASKEQFLANLKDAGYAAPEHFDTITRDSIEAAGANFLDDSIDFIFLDGNHAYPYVKDEIIAWLPKVKETGMIAGHDFPAWPVRKSVDESLKNYSTMISSVRHDNTPSSWYAYKKDQ